MKSVLISIHPKWCALIASGKKTIEVRKTAPKLPTPFKCYIYCTQDKGLSFWKSKTYAYADDRSHNMFDIRGNGKVIGEFVCDLIGFHPGTDVPSSCVPIEELKKYANGKMLARWHISDVKIYDQPKELWSFWKADKCPYATESGCTYKYHCFRAGQTQRCGETLTRPPQSWCYVEEMP
jgi:hypothetical protein